MTTEPTFTLNREHVEGWIDSGARVFCVHTSRDGRIAMSGKIIRIDTVGLVISTAHDRDARGTFVRFEQLVTLRLAASRAVAPAETPAPEVTHGDG